MRRFYTILNNGNVESVVAGPRTFASSAGDVLFRSIVVFLGMVPQQFPPHSRKPRAELRHVLHENALRFVFASFDVEVSSRELLPVRMTRLRGPQQPVQQFANARHTPVAPFTIASPSPKHPTQATHTKMHKIMIPDIIHQLSTFHVSSSDIFEFFALCIGKSGYGLQNQISAPFPPLWQFVQLRTLV